MRTDPIRGGRHILIASAGWFVWGSCFAVLYLLQGLGCHTSMIVPDVLGLNGLNVVLATVWIGHLGAIAGLEVAAVRGWAQQAPPRQPGEFLQALARINNLTAFAATLCIGFPVLVLSPCV